MLVICLPWHVPLSPIQSFTALPLKSQLSPSWILNMQIWCLSTAPWTVSVSVDGHYLWVIFLKNSGALIDSLLMIALPSLATVLVIIITNGHLNMLLIETSPVCGSTKFLNRWIRIRSAFIIQIWEIICQIIQCPEFYPVNPHFPVRIVPLVPWIRTGKKITANGHIQNQIKIVIKGLAILIVKSFLKIAIQINLKIWMIIKIEF